MNAKPVSPTQHGINDYLFAATQLLAPAPLGFNAKAVNLYRLLGSNLLLTNLLTDYPKATPADTPVSAASVIPYQTHRLIDIVSVSGLALLSVHNAIRRDRRVLGFHLGYTALAALHIILTDWRADRS